MVSSCDISGWGNREAQVSQVAQNLFSHARIASKQESNVA